MTSSRRLLLVHAHPDDETINSGATMARYVAEGAQVTLVTCTLGEEGEVLVPSLALLAVDHADQLGGWRVHELDKAMALLGVTDHRFLGGAGRFRDSGMMGSPANEKPRAFWRADSDPAVFHEAVVALVEVIREVQPQVVATYDENGGYGHPDHIMAHRVTMAAVEAAAEPGFIGASGEAWQVSKVYWSAFPHSWGQAALDALRDIPDTPFTGVESVEDLGMTVPDDQVTTAIDAHTFLDAKMKALAAHETQISVDGPFFALSNHIGQRAWGVEFYRLVRGEAGGERDADGRETDLFGGVE